MSSPIVACPECGSKNRVPVSAKGIPQCAKCHAKLPWLVNAGDGDLAAALDTKALVLIDLWAPWCGPCRAVAPVLERLAKRYAGKVKVVKINVDDNRRSASRYEAQSIPTLVMVKKGQTVARFVGAQPEPVLAKRIDALLNS